RLMESETEFQNIINKLRDELKQQTLVAQQHLRQYQQLKVIHKRNGKVNKRLFSLLYQTEMAELKRASSTSRVVKFPVPLTLVSPAHAPPALPFSPDPFAQVPQSCSASTSPLPLPKNPDSKSAKSVSASSFPLRLFSPR